MGEKIMTIDMTNNRVPYGLLTDEETAALLAHEKAGGEFKCYCEGVWSKCDPSWSTEGIYRAVPLPKTQDVIAWDRLPNWAQWVARDIDGKVFMYDAPPDLRGDEWVSGFAVQGPINDFPGLVQIGTADWTESKQRRPRG
jgi:hypothetical protein